MPSPVDHRTPPGQAPAAAVAELPAGAELSPLGHARLAVWRVRGLAQTLSLADRRGLSHDAADLLLDVTGGQGGAQRARRALERFRAAYDRLSDDERAELAPELRTLARGVQRGR